MQSVTAPEGRTRQFRDADPATPALFASALIQYNSSTHVVSANARLRWEYRPGSELFVVYNEERDSEATTGVPALQNRAFIVKVNRFFRF